MNKKLKEKNYFKSSDICLCSALCCFDYQIEKVIKDNPSKVIFVIRKNEKLDELINKYFTHQLKVEPLSFFNFLKEIKTRIYNS